MLPATTVASTPRAGSDVVPRTDAARTKTPAITEVTAATEGRPVRGEASASAADRTVA
jgi:hypothetical protein